MSKYCPLVNEPVLYPVCQDCDDPVCRHMDSVFALLIAGSRSFTDYEFLRDTADRMLSGQQGRKILIVEGGARGADQLAARYARERGYRHLVFPANWRPQGPGGPVDKRAGYVRNRQMHAYVAQFPHRGVLLFWDGVSRGTRQSIDLAGEFGSQLRVYRFVRV